MSQRFLVTGGAGYLGSEVVRRLCAQPDDTVGEVVVYDNLSRSNANLFIGHTLPRKAVRFVRGDLLDTRRLRNEVAQADVIVHLAARVSTPFSDADPHGFDQVNHWGTAELVGLVEQSGHAPRVVHASSASVYGTTTSREGVGIGDPAQPGTAYAISKLLAEEEMARLGDQLPLTMLRCANVYGYNACVRFDALVNRFMLDAHFSSRITVDGPVEQRRALVHIGSAARVFEAAALGSLGPGTFDLVERNLSVEDLIETLSGLYPELETLYVHQHMPGRSLSVRSDERVPTELIDTRTFAEQLVSFRERFAFG